jgi:hypothetical protein
MKAIIIQDHDARALLDQLEIEAIDPKGRDYASIEIAVQKILDAKLMQHGLQLDPRARIEVAGAVASLLAGHSGEIVKTIHRRFHYVVTRWLQEQGANCVR